MDYDFICIRYIKFKAVNCSAEFSVSVLQSFGFEQHEIYTLLKYM